MRKGFLRICKEVKPTTFLAQDLHVGGGSGDRRRDIMELGGDGVCGVAAGGVCP